MCSHPIGHGNRGSLTESCAIRHTHTYKLCLFISHTHTHMHTHTHTCTRTHAHTRTHVHTTTADQSFVIRDVCTHTHTL